MTKAVIINGGNNVSSRLTGIEQHIQTFLTNEGVEHEVIQVHQLPAEDLIKANYVSEEIVKQVLKVGEADIVFILTPVYKGAYSGILKTFIDLLPQKGLENKIVVPIAIGGSMAHLLSIEYALKPVLSILGATTITNSIYIVDSQVERVVGGKFKVSTEAVERIEKVLSTISFKQKVEA